METPQRKYGPFDIGGHEKIPEIGHLTSFGSASLEIKRPNNDENNSKLPNDRRAKYLIGEAGKLNMTNAFYNESRRVQSNLEWKMRCQMLKEANSLGSSEAKEIYLESLESKHYNRDLVECWIEGHEDELDVKIIRAFFWEHLALEEEKEKSELIKAYLTGLDVYQDEARAQYWINFKIKEF